MTSKRLLPQGVSKGLDEKKVSAGWVFEEVPVEWSAGGCYEFAYGELPTWVDKQSLEGLSFEALFGGL